MFYDYDYEYTDIITDDYELKRDLLTRSQRFLDLIFEKVGINEKSKVSIVNFRKRDHFNFDEMKWDSEIFQRKAIYQKGNLVYKHNDEKRIPIEKYLLPKDQGKIIKELAKDYIDELTFFSRENHYIFVIDFDYKNIIGGKKEIKEIYDDLNEEYIKIIPTYGIEDGLVTIFSVEKDIKKEIENYTFLIEVFKLITRRKFSEMSKIEQIDDLLLKAGLTALNDKIYKSFLVDLEEKESVNLYNLMHNISLLKYESSENRGNILFCSRDIELESKLILTKPIPLTEYSSITAIRKLLEISGGDVSLLSDGNFVFGIGKRNGIQDLPRKAFIINFKGQGEWDVVTAKNQKVMSVTYRVPSMPKVSVKEAEFAKQFEKTFGFSEYQNVWRFIDLAKNQSHGTMVVITKEAEREAERLCNQSFLINKITDLQNGIINGITAIDGAVLLDDTGGCYAIGVILDGIANEKIGTISRGARYNSALRYLNYCKENSIPCLIVIVSEDKYIDIKTVHDL